MEKQWYVVNTYSGHEKKVQEKLLMRAESMNMQDYIFRVIVPEQEETEIKDGVKKTKVKKLFPGYILVEMKLGISFVILQELQDLLAQVVKELNLLHYNLVK